MKIPNPAEDVFEALRTAQLDLVEQKCLAFLASCDRQDLVRVHVEGCSCVGVGHQDFSVKFWAGFGPVRPIEDAPINIRRFDPEPEYVWQVWSHWAEACPHIVARKTGQLWNIK